MISMLLRIIRVTVCKYGCVIDYVRMEIHHHLHAIIVAELKMGAENLFGVT